MSWEPVFSKNYTIFCEGYAKLQGECLRAILKPKYLSKEKKRWQVLYYYCRICLVMLFFRKIKVIQKNNQEVFCLPASHLPFISPPSWFTYAAGPGKGEGRNGRAGVKNGSYLL